MKRSLTNLGLVLILAMAFFMVACDSGGGCGINPTPTPTPTLTPTPTPTPATNGQCQIYYDKNQWDTGFSCNVTITNTGSQSISGWDLTWTFANGQQISSSWNALVTQSGNQATASDESYNGMIAPNGGHVTFGFQATHTGTNNTPGDFELNGVSCSVDTDPSDTGTDDDGTPDGEDPDDGTVDDDTQPSDTVTVTIDTARNLKSISPLIYGYNTYGAGSDLPAEATWLRMGGNRWTAYNWTNNYSNAGTDWGPYSNDDNLGDPSQGPGGAVVATIDDAKARGISAQVTIPIQGWVARDGNGPVDINSPITDHFVPNLPKKGSAFTLSPSPTSETVYQDEFANFVAQRWDAGAQVHLSLDNEPSLWYHTHAEIQRTRIGYADFLALSIASAKAIREAVPRALIYGPALFGYGGFVNFAQAPDAPSNASDDNSFIDYYLKQMNEASTTARLLDVLDIHFYSEATSSGCTDSSANGYRIINSWSNPNLPCIVATRVQAPRSLSDPTYVESSWITRDCTKYSKLGAAIQLIPRMLAKIDAEFPGTRLAITEYSHGGGDHISGAIAQADTLGTFGREGVYAAAYYKLIWGDKTEPWATAAWRAFRNYDGAGENFGDTSVQAVSSDLAHVSVYAGMDAASANRLVLVVIHRPTLANGSTLDLRSRTVTIQWSHAKTLRTARAWQLADGTTPVWRAISAPAISGSEMTVTLPALTVTTIELTP